jgi:antitoxin (DNA-binding transcriptional repressor) of toxin-antitoxin stability system
VQAGERLLVTDRDRPVAVLSPLSATEPDRRIEAMLREGEARWGGGKPQGSRRPPRLKGAKRGAGGDRRPAVTLYLDTSALVKLYVDEEGALAVRHAVDQAELVATSAIAYAEARAAFARRHWEGGCPLVGTGASPGTSKETGPAT